MTTNTDRVNDVTGTVDSDCITSINSDNCIGPDGSKSLGDIMTEICADRNENLVQKLEKLLQSDQLPAWCHHTPAAVMLVIRQVLDSHDVQAGTALAGILEASLPLVTLENQQALVDAYVHLQELADSVKQQPMNAGLHDKKVMVNINCWDAVHQLHMNLCQMYPGMCGCLLERLGHRLLLSSVSPTLHHLFRQTHCKALNMLLERCSARERAMFRERHTDLFLKLPSMLRTAGDYDFQTCLVEAVFRLSSNAERNASISSWFPQLSCTHKALFTRICDFDPDCRRFLNAYNSQLGSDRLVHTYAASSATLGCLPLLKPSVASYEKLWVDFNLGGGTVSVLCDKANPDVPTADREWETVTVYADEVVRAMLCCTLHAYTLLLQLDKPPLYYFTSPPHHTQSPMQESLQEPRPIFKVVLESAVQHLEQVLEKIYGKKLQVERHLPEGAREGGGLLPLTPRRRYFAAEGGGRRKSSVSAEVLRAASAPLPIHDDNHQNEVSLASSGGGGLERSMQSPSFQCPGAERLSHVLREGTPSAAYGQRTRQSVKTSVNIASIYCNIDHVDGEGETVPSTVGDDSEEVIPVSLLQAGATTPVGYAVRESEQWTPRDSSGVTSGRCIASAGSGRKTVYPDTSSSEEELLGGRKTCSDNVNGNRADPSSCEDETRENRNMFIGSSNEKAASVNGTAANEIMGHGKNISSLGNNEVVVAFVENKTVASAMPLTDVNVCGGITSMDCTLQSSVISNDSSQPTFQSASGLNAEKFTESASCDKAEKADETKLIDFPCSLPASLESDVDVIPCSLLHESPSNIVNKSRLCLIRKNKPPSEDTDFDAISTVSVLAVSDVATTLAACASGAVAMALDANEVVMDPINLQSLNEMESLDVVHQALAPIETQTKTDVNFVTQCNEYVDGEIHIATSPNKQSGKELPAAAAAIIEDQTEKNVEKTLLIEKEIVENIEGASAQRRIQRNLQYSVQLPLHTMRDMKIAPVPEKHVKGMQVASVPDKQVVKEMKLASVPDKQVKEMQVASMPDKQVVKERKLASVPDKQVKEMQVASVPDKKVKEVQHASLPENQVVKEMQVAAVPVKQIVNEMKRVSVLDKQVKEMQVASVPDKQVVKEMKLVSVLDKQVKEMQVASVPDKQIVKEMKLVSVLDKQVKEMQVASVPDKQVKEVQDASLPGSQVVKEMQIASAPEKQVKEMQVALVPEKQFANKMLVASAPEAQVAKEIQVESTLKKQVVKQVQVQSAFEHCNYEILKHGKTYCPTDKTEVVVAISDHYNDSTELDLVDDRFMVGNEAMSEATTNFNDTVYKADKDMSTNLERELLEGYENNERIIKCNIVNVANSSDALTTTHDSALCSLKRTAERRFVPLSECSPELQGQRTTSKEVSTEQKGSTALSGRPSCKRALDMEVARSLSATKGRIKRKGEKTPFSETCQNTTKRPKYSNDGVCLRTPKQSKPAQRSTKVKFVKSPLTVIKTIIREKNAISLKDEKILKERDHASIDSLLCTSVDKLNYSLSDSASTNGEELPYIVSEDHIIAPVEALPTSLASVVASTETGSKTVMEFVKSPVCQSVPETEDEISFSDACLVQGNYNSKIFMDGFSAAVYSEATDAYSYAEATYNSSCDRLLDMSAESSCKPCEAVADCVVTLQDLEFVVIPQSKHLPAGVDGDGGSAKSTQQANDAPVPLASQSVAASRELISGVQNSLLLSSDNDPCNKTQDDFAQEEVTDALIFTENIVEFSTSNVIPEYNDLSRDIAENSETFKRLQSVLCSPKLLTDLNCPLLIANAERADSSKENRQWYAPILQWTELIEVFSLNLDDGVAASEDVNVGTVASNVEHFFGSLMEGCKFSSDVHRHVDLVLSASDASENAGDVSSGEGKDNVSAGLEVVSPLQGHPCLLTPRGRSSSLSCSRGNSIPDHSNSSGGGGRRFKPKKSVNKLPSHYHHVAKTVPNLNTPNKTIVKTTLRNSACKKKLFDASVVLLQGTPPNEDLGANNTNKSDFTMGDIVPLDSSFSDHVSPTFKDNEQKDSRIKPKRGRPKKKKVQYVANNKTKIVSKSLRSSGVNQQSSGSYYKKGNSSQVTEKKGKFFKVYEEKPSPIKFRSKKEKESFERDRRTVMSNAKKQAKLCGPFSSSDNDDTDHNNGLQQKSVFSEVDSSSGHSWLRGGRNKIDTNRYKKTYSGKSYLKALAHSSGEEYKPKSVRNVENKSKRSKKPSPAYLMSGSGSDSEHSLSLFKPLKPKPKVRKVPSNNICGTRFLRNKSPLRPYKVQSTSSEMSLHDGTKVTENKTHLDMAGGWAERVAREEPSSEVLRECSRSSLERSLEVTEDMAMDVHSKNSSKDRQKNKREKYVSKRKSTEKQESSKKIRIMDVEENAVMGHDREERHEDFRSNNENNKLLSSADAASGLKQLLEQVLPPGPSIRLRERKQPSSVYNVTREPPPVPHNTPIQLEPTGNNRSLGLMGVEISGIGMISELRREEGPLQSTFMDEPGRLLFLSEARGASLEYSQQLRCSAQGGKNVDNKRVDDSLDKESQLEMVEVTDYGDIPDRPWSSDSNSECVESEAIKPKLKILKGRYSQKNSSASSNFDQLTSANVMNQAVVAGVPAAAEPFHELGSAAPASSPIAALPSHEIFTSVPTGRWSLECGQAENRRVQRDTTALNARQGNVTPERLTGRVLFGPTLSSSALQLSLSSDRPDDVNAITATPLSSNRVMDPRLRDDEQAESDLVLVPRGRLVLLQELLLGLRDAINSRVPVILDELSQMLGQQQ